ncbi:hypothetical protein JB92DRAFT_2761236 [Gautieria morchelliformis]|nr:hypothetical protein JB92DRAFT_2761236 [Gautieria morchelliformis]
MARLTAILLLIFTFTSHLTEVVAFPAYGSLAGLSEEELAMIIPTLEISKGPPPDIHAKPDNIGVPVLVNDANHPYVPPGPDDIRGPCPGLNTLANHGYLPHDGVASPKQIMNGVMTGFNMGADIAAVVVFAAHLADGNLLTDKLSIGGPRDGSRGLNYHGTFEGDVSMTRGDAYFGDNHSFNETLFQKMQDEADPFFNTFNIRSAATHRFKRIKDGISGNPKFAFNHIRYPAGYAESVFTYLLFRHPWTPLPAVKMDVIRTFFQDGKMPDGFHRAPLPIGMLEIAAEVVLLWAQYPIVLPGHNVDGINTYRPDLTSPSLITWCWIYGDFVKNTVVKLYPNPSGQLRSALKRNLVYFHLPFAAVGCPPLFPYGLPLSEDEGLLDQAEVKGVVDQIQAPVSSGWSSTRVWDALVRTMTCWA